MEYYRGHVYAFRDNLSNDEVDAIVEFSDGEYGAIEIKLGDNQIDEAIKSLVVYLEKSLLKVIPNLAYVSKTISPNNVRTSSSILGE